MQSQQTLIPQAQDALAVTSEQPPITSLQILEAAVRGGITGENVAVVKEIIAMRREEMAAQNKALFNQAFFQLKREISTMDFYADKVATTETGKLLYKFCSEFELTSKLDPVLQKHGFTMMFGQRQDNERVVAEVTLVHEAGHEERREYAVRMGATNRAKDATQADTGSTTSAWRHLVIKLFGLKSRISEDADLRNQGEFIKDDQITWLKERLVETGGNEASFLALAGASCFEEITTGAYPVLTRALEAKARSKK